MKLSYLALAGALFLPATAPAKDSDGPWTAPKRKPASAGCFFTYNNGWEIRVGTTWFAGLNANASLEEKVQLAEVAKVLTESGVCKF